jgi:hypothetical protein
MKYPWIDEYLMARRGVTKDLQATRDLSMTDDQFRKSIEDRVSALKRC